MQPITALTYSTRELALTGMFTAITAILAQISIPITPVVFSFGIFGAMLAGSILTTKLAVTSQVVYVFLGAVGAPVLSGFGGGFQRITGPNGGYLVAYIFIALVMGLLYARKGGEPTFWEATLYSLCGVGVCYVCGAGWLGFSMGYGLRQTITAGILPFAAMDTVKALVAAAVGIRVRSALRQANLLS